MLNVGRDIAVRGEIEAAEDITIEGRVDGPIWCEGCAVTIGPSATINSDIVARDITVFGTVTGTLVATEVVDIRPEASVTGRVVSTRLILTEGAMFSGTSEPQHLEAAMRVARHRRTGTAQSPKPDTAAPRPGSAARVASRP